MKFITFGCWNNGLCNLNNDNGMSKVFNFLNKKIVDINPEYLFILGDNYYPSKNKKEKKKILNKENFESGFNCIKKLPNKKTDKYILFGNHEYNDIIDDIKCKNIDSQFEILQNDKIKLFKDVIILNNNDTIMIQIDTTIFENNEKDIEISCYKNIFNQIKKNNKTKSELIREIIEYQTNKVNMYLDTIDLQYKKIIFFGHHPICFSKSKQTDDGIKIKKGLMNKLFLFFENILEDRQVSEIDYICADVHFYEKSVIENHNKNYKINQYIVGTGGADFDTPINGKILLDNSTYVELDDNISYLIYEQKKMNGFILYNNGKYNFIQVNITTPIELCDIFTSNNSIQSISNHIIVYMDDNIKMLLKKFMFWINICLKNNKGNIQRCIFIKRCINNIFWYLDEIQEVNKIELALNLNKPDDILIFRKKTAIEYATELKENGVIVIQSQILLDLLPELNRDFIQTIKELPEFKRNKNDPNRTENNLLLKYVLGGFSALGNASSFHNMFVRKLREWIMGIVIPIMACIHPNNIDYKLEQIIDRIMYRRPLDIPSKESWHRDESIHSKDEDEIFGGWINLNIENNQYFSCIPKSHKRNNIDKGGFSTIPKEQYPKLNKLKERIIIPPGSIILFYENILHEVLSIPQKHYICRLFLAWRLTKQQSTLIPNLDVLLDNQDVIPLKSGQETPMYAKLHWTNWRSTKLEPWSLETFNPNMLERKKVLSGRDKDQVYNIVKRNMPSLRELDNMYEFYSEREKKQYFPNRNWKLYTIGSHHTFTEYDFACNSESEQKLVQITIGNKKINVVLNDEQTLDIKDLLKQTYKK